MQKNGNPNNTELVKQAIELLNQIQDLKVHNLNTSINELINRYSEDEPDNYNQRISGNAHNALKKMSYISKISANKIASAIILEYYYKNESDFKFII